MRWGYLQDRGDKTAYIDNVIANLEKLETLRIGTYSQLVDRVATREHCLTFLQRAAFDSDCLMQTLNYLLRWVLPFKTPVREFVDVDCVEEVKSLEVLKQHGVRSNLDLLDDGQTKAARLRFSRMTGIRIAFVTALVHKADISRLAYVRGKTVKHLCGGGYDTLRRPTTACTSTRRSAPCGRAFRVHMVSVSTLVSGQCPRRAGEADGRRPGCDPIPY